jgi:hypothetical protein
MANKNKPRKTREQMLADCAKHKLPQSTTDAVMAAYDMQSVNHEAADKGRGEYLAKMYDRDCD